MPQVQKRNRIPPIQMTHKVIPASKNSPRRETRKLQQCNAATATQPYDPPAINVNGEHVLRRSLLHYGTISDRLENLQLWDPTFTVPYLIHWLFKQGNIRSIYEVREKNIRISLILFLIVINESIYHNEAELTVILCGAYYIS